MTLPSSFDKSGAQWAWDSTSIKAAEACPRRYQYEMIEGWADPRGSVHLWFGGLYAKALETYHVLRAQGIDYEEACHEVVEDALLNSWDHDLTPEGERIPNTGGPRTYPDPNKTRDNLIRSIVWYLDQFREDHFTTYVTAEGQAAVEHSFKIEVDNGITFCGHIDRLCVDPAGELFVHDQKTTSTTLSPYYFKKFKPDSQFAMYTFASKMIYSAPVKGVIIDAAQVVVGFTRFDRAPTFRTDSELEEWYQETMMLIERTRGYSLDGFFPRNPASCNNYGGCPFREVCSKPPSVRENFLQGDFTKREKLWNPMEER